MTTKGKLVMAGLALGAIAIANAYAPPEPKRDYTQAMLAAARADMAAARKGIDKEIQDKTDE